MKRSGDGTERAGWLYLARILGGLVAVSIVAVALVALGGRKPPDTTSSENSKNVYFFREKKLSRAKSLASPKLVVISGSTGLFSVRSEILQGFSGLPTVNLGVQAGLGLDYILYDARRVIRPGDTVLLILEYEHFMNNGAREWSQADFTLHHDPGWVLRVGPAKALELVKLLSNREMLGVLWRGVWSVRVDGTPYAVAIDDWSDVTVNTGERVAKVASQLAAFKSPMSFSGSVISDFARREIDAFVKWCRGRNVTVVAAAPPFLYFPEYETNGFFEFAGAIQGLYESMGVEVLGTPASSFFKREQFFDTWYHLTRETAGEYSAALAHELVRVPKYAASFQEGIDLSRRGLPYFIQSVEGLSAWEPWGRWSDSKEVEWRFSRLPPQPLHLVMELQAFGTNLDQLLTIRYGSQVRTVRLTSKTLTEVDVRFAGIEKSLEMQWLIPEPQAPADVIAESKDTRKLGVGVRKIRFVSDKP